MQHHSEFEDYGDEFEDYGEYEDQEATCPCGRSGELESELEGGFGDGEYETGTDEEFELEAGEAGSPFDGADEMELAAELLTVSSDAELDRFLGKVFRRIGRRLGRPLRRLVAHRLAGRLRPFIRRAVPFAGRAFGGAIGGPAGAALGGRLASHAGRVFGLELEGLSPEDQEFEVARGVVRVAGAAAAEAAQAPPSAAPPAVAKAAIASAVRSHAPGLTHRGPTAASAGRRRRGRWIRRGRKIVLFGV